MTSKQLLRFTQSSGVLAGFGNFLRKDGDEWWGTRRGLLHLVLWTMVVGGSFVIRLVRGAGPDPIISTYALEIGLLTPIGILIVMQDAVIGERESGTAAWLLTKPVSRAAFLLSKLAVNGASLILVTVVVQGAFAYRAVLMAGGSPGLGGWIGGMALLALKLMSYLSLTLMLGTLFSGRGPLVGIAIGALVAAFILGRFVPMAGQILPLAVFQPLARDQPLAAEAMLGRSPTVFVPVVATITWCSLFVLAAIWRFQKEEF